MSIKKNIERIKQIMGFNRPNYKEFNDPQRERFTCQDCGNYDYEMYMVNDDLWKKYGNDNLTLCKSCFEKRIGRKINKDDMSEYKDAPVNIYNPELKDLYI
jgi:hypothetical protein